MATKRAGKVRETYQSTLTGVFYPVIRMVLSSRTKFNIGDRVRVTVERLPKKRKSKHGRG